jgi:hypothetical protein
VYRVLGPDVSIGKPVECILDPKFRDERSLESCRLLFGIGEMVETKKSAIELRSAAGNTLPAMLVMRASVNGRDCTATLFPGHSFQADFLEWQTAKTYRSAGRPAGAGGVSSAPHTSIPISDIGTTAHIGQAVKPIFVEMDTLRKVEQGDKVEWTEVAHWKHGLEQSVAKGKSGEMEFGRAHLSTVKFHDFLLLRKLITRGTVMIDLEVPAEATAGAALHFIASAVVNDMIASGALADDNRDEAMQVVQAQHHHATERRKRKLVDDARTRRHHHSSQHSNGGAQQNGAAGPQNGSGGHVTPSTARQQSTSTNGGHTVDSSEMHAGSSVVAADTSSPESAAHSQHGGPTGQQNGAQAAAGEEAASQRGMLSLLSLPHATSVMPHGSNGHGGAASSSADKGRAAPSIARAISRERHHPPVELRDASDEACDVLAGTVSFLEEQAAVFVRLKTAVDLGQITEHEDGVKPPPVRFVFLVLGPPESERDNQHVGHAIACMMSNRDFASKAQVLASKDDLLEVRRMRCCAALRWLCPCPLPLLCVCAG